MDCDTTGIQPDFSLVKFKKLVGGGSMQIVNTGIAMALENLGYSPDAITSVSGYVAEHGNVVDAPHLNTEHYAIFDSCMGERFIAPMGHVRMMADCQQFLSGAISKTVNMPDTASLRTSKRSYTRGWELGLKALAIYRDTGKVGQPLSRRESQEHRR
jgi:Ribonucleotide reductase, alpha subunit